MKKVLFFLVLLLQYFLVNAQNTSDKIEMADAMREDGKIYVVVAVVIIILAGILLYLFSLDKKIKNLEKEIQNKNL